MKKHEKIKIEHESTSKTNNDCEHKKLNEYVMNKIFTMNGVDLNVSIKFMTLNCTSSTMLN